MEEEGKRAALSLKVILPPGTVVSAVHPAPYRVWMTYPMTIIDTIFKALAPAIPDRVIAGHHAEMNYRTIPSVIYTAPEVVAAMRDRGVDLSSQTPQRLTRTSTSVPRGSGASMTITGQMAFTPSIRESFERSVRLILIERPLNSVSNA